MSKHPQTAAKLPKTTPAPGPAEDPKGTALAPQEDPKAGLPAALDFGDDQGAGMEDLGADEQVIPFITVLQSNSPQVDESEAKHVPGAKPGMLFNTATQELYTSLEILPAARDHNFTKYIPREQGGGFEGILAPNDPVVQQLRQAQGQFGKLTMDAGKYELQEVFYLFCWVSGGGRPFGAIVPFKSTQIKKYKTMLTIINTQLVYEREINGKIKLIRPPMWAHRWKLTTKPESNKKGKYHGVNLELAGGSKEQSLLPPASEPYIMAKNFYELIKAGRAKVDYSQAQATGDGADDMPGDFG